MVENEKILVGWDGSEKSRNALRYAIDEAKDKGLKSITAVHVEKGESARLRAMLKDYKIEVDRDILKNERSKIGSLLKEAESIGDEEGMKVEARVIKHGYGPAVDIVKFAEKNSFKHIIIGSHGRSGISRIALGSVARGIVEKAHCIVTVVRCSWP
ncbi:hypothetical protein AKJ37_00445 [candidate division MSBL1 archaeon SCGC-AAA259I09]|uniref:UspA domain-containing protein n=3 Tax=candidate division MSBL1 TaxID=215777 RepID=A0A133UW17_9EURY|nr:hypothetical protein AKJ62_03455 [candidate division MSBL1 archaeon SCGC-AAA259D14]KXA95466.1 hypothetical protein AKJ36_00430 [candidate division MSBL1 archaeon SCGC-AAA259I07]KXA98369.1 hypothetical protein AKJ37_00445 [candidate division MSBL1 archaeon SCGC-AAA259I09]